MFARVFLLAACDLSPYGFWQSVRKNPQLMPTTSTSSTKALERWEVKHVCLLIASYMKFKGEFGKSHITQQSIRSDFWFGRVPFSHWLIRVVSDRSLRYNRRHGWSNHSFNNNKKDQPIYMLVCVIRTCGHILFFVFLSPPTCYRWKNESEDYKMNITPFLACWYIGTFALEAKC